MNMKRIAVDPFVRGSRELSDGRGLNVNECIVVESVKDIRLNNECLTSVTVLVTLNVSVNTRPISKLYLPYHNND